MKKTLPLIALTGGILLLMCSSSYHCKPIDPDRQENYLKKLMTPVTKLHRSSTSEKGKEELLQKRDLDTDDVLFSNDNIFIEPNLRDSSKVGGGKNGASAVSAGSTGRITGGGGGEMFDDVGGPLMEKRSSPSDLENVLYVNDNAFARSVINVDDLDSAADMVFLPRFRKQRIDVNRYRVRREASSDDGNILENVRDITGDIENENDLDTAQNVFMPRFRGSRINVQRYRVSKRDVHDDGDVDTSDDDENNGRNKGRDGDVDVEINSRARSRSRRRRDAVLVPSYLQQYQYSITDDLIRNVERTRPKVAHSYTPFFTVRRYYVEEDDLL